MGCRVIEGKDGEAVMYCSTTMWAFGPVFPSVEAVEMFFRWYTPDPRGLDDGRLMEIYNDFITRFVCECDTVRDPDEEEEPPKGERYRCDFCKKKDRQKKGGKRT